MTGPDPEPRSPAVNTPAGADPSWRTRLRDLLFPDPPRSFSGRRSAKISARAVHVLCAGVLVGSYLLDAPSDARADWLTLTIATGLVLLLLDLHESAGFLLQARGLFVISKVILLLALPEFGATAGYLLAAILLLSVVMSHAPSRLRYFAVIGGTQVRGARSKG